MSRFHLAHVNIARMRYDFDAPEFKDFVDALGPVNDVADQSPGFVWRLQSESDQDKDLQAFEALGWLFNMSVWTSLESLVAFVRSHLHLSVMRRRAEWFTKVEVHTCLWWVEEGHIPGFGEAMARIDLLKANGPTQHSFNFKESFPPPAG